MFRVESINELSSHRGGDGVTLPAWLQFDYGFEPASIVFRLSQPEPPGVLGPNRTIAVAASDALLGASAPVPFAFISDREDGAITIPLVLRSNTAGLPPPPQPFALSDRLVALWNKGQWTQRYLYNPCVPLTTAVEERSLFGSGEGKKSTYDLTTWLWQWEEYVGDPLQPDYAYNGCTSR